jgi:opacity protein-like surface antigen
MKKALLCASLIAISTSSFAADTNSYSGVYVRGDIGASKTLALSKSGSLKKYDGFKPTYGAGVGYKFNENVRADINIQRRTAKTADKVSFKNTSVFLNSYYDFKSSSDFTPYLTAGIGYAENNFSKGLPTGLENVKSKNFAYGLGFGSKFNVSDNFDIDLAYRVVNLGKAQSKNSSTNAVSGFKSNISHELTTGVIFSF